MTSGRRPLATPAQLSEFLQVPGETLRDWRKRKRGPRWIKVGQLVRYPWDGVDEWLESCKSA